jgi:hypothetical protein
MMRGLRGGGVVGAGCMVLVAALFVQVKMDQSQQASQLIN